MSLLFITEHQFPHYAINVNNTCGHNGIDLRIKADGEQFISWFNCKAILNATMFSINNNVLVSIEMKHDKRCILRLSYKEVFSKSVRNVNTLFRQQLIHVIKL